MSALAASLKMSKQHATQIIDKLYQHDLVERFSDEKDRRSIYIGISTSGQSFLMDHQWKGDVLYSQIKENLTQEEIQQLEEASQVLLRLLPKLQ